MSLVWDAVIGGAGPAGAVAAHVLARAGRKVLLIDDGEPRSRRVGESLPGAARPLLRDLNLLTLVEAGPHIPCYGNVSAWGSTDAVATDFIRDPHGPGWRLDRARFDLDLRTAATEAGAITKTGRVEATASTDEGFRLDLDGEAGVARWLIDATGRGAFIARSQGAMRSRDDELVALYAWARPHPGDADTRTLVESIPDGWWYSALLPDNTRVAVLHVDAEDAPAILHTRGAWLAQLARTSHVSRALGGAGFLCEPRGTEACGARLDRFGGRGWLAAGDAALSFDPLSSQGIFDAIYTGMKAARAVDASLSGDTQAVEEYSMRLESIRAAYLERHRLVYETEARWSDRPFWRRRRSSQ